MKNVAYKIIDNWLIAANGEVAPSEDEFREILALFKEIDRDRMRMLVFTKGGAPTAMHRKQLHAVLQGKDLTTAVVSDVYFIRGIVTAMSWFNNHIKVFPTSAIEEAFRYLEIPYSQYDQFRREAIKLQAEVAVRSARRRY
jgi:hypothetical protein